MKVTKQNMKELKKGTIIDDFNGPIILTSDYDENHDWYLYNNTRYDENDDLIEVQEEGKARPTELLGKEIIGQW